MPASNTKKFYYQKNYKDMTNILIATGLLLTLIIITIVLYVFIMIAIESGMNGKSHDRYDCDNCDFKDFCDKHYKETETTYYIL